MDIPDQVWRQKTASFSLSGGKDSTATYLYALEGGFIDKFTASGGEVIRVFADTGWELPETYDYIEQLEARFGKIHRVAAWVPGPGEAKPGGFDHLESLWKTKGYAMDSDRWALAKVFEARLGRYSPMVRIMLQYAKMPSTRRRWCTSDLKRDPIVNFYAGIDSPVSIVGVRSEESKKRAELPVIEWSDNWDCWVWRPIHHLKLADVIAIHSRHGIAPNPLYLQGVGAGRVGCAPCVHETKTSIRWLSIHHHSRMSLLSDLQRSIADMPSSRKLAGAGAATWFFLQKTLDSGEKVSWGVSPEEAIEWSLTARGGRQHILLRDEDEPGCTQWGLCGI